VTFSTNATMARFAGPSFQDGSGSVAPAGEEARAATIAPSAMNSAPIVIDAAVLENAWVFMMSAP
jgi:hypothetical protein